MRRPLMPRLADHPTLPDYQRYVAELEEERGFADQTVLEKCLLLGEEVGELFKTIREATGMSVDTQTAVSPVADELADVFIMLCSIANRAGVDLDTAFRAKEEKNRERTWR
jgi:NTP pyrophosphatase (non-canonical NTP hydrolase)